MLSKINIEKIKDNFNAYIVMQSLTENIDQQKEMLIFQIKESENFIGELKINNCISLEVKISGLYYVHNYKYIELLYSENFITLRFYLFEHEKKLKNHLLNFHIKNKKLNKNIYNDNDRLFDLKVYSFKFDNVDDFMSLFDYVFIGDCYLQ